MALLPPSLTVARLSFASVCLFVILFLWQHTLPKVDLEKPDLPIQTEVKPDLPIQRELESPLTSSLCRSLPGAEDVVVAIRTGAMEAFTRLPEQLLTLSRCVPNLLVFSDVEQDLGDYHLYSALDEVSDKYTSTNEDFEFYRKLQTYQGAHQDLSTLTSSDQGWKLDKWKFIPMLHKTYQKYPDSKWFVFIDSDTFLGWTNLLQMLERLDPEKELYLGIHYVYGPTVFAQGGGGIIVSNAAVNAFERIRDAEHIVKWEANTSTSCCGDVIVGEALFDAGVKLTPAWPLMQLEQPATFEWSEGMWCRPAVTWHHVHPFEIEALWEFEHDWIEQTFGHEAGAQVPYLFKDLFDYFVEPHISSNLSDWNNLSRDRTFTEPYEDHPKEDTNWDGLSAEEKQKLWEGLSEIEQLSTKSAEACYTACEADAECLQYSFKPGSCHLNRVVRLGSVVDGDKHKGYVSGWMLERIKHFKESQPACKPNWVVDGIEL